MNPTQPLNSSRSETLTNLANSERLPIPGNFKAMVQWRDAGSMNHSELFLAFVQFAFELSKQRWDAAMTIVEYKRRTNPTVVLKMRAVNKPNLQVMDQMRGLSLCLRTMIEIYQPEMRIPPFVCGFGQSDGQLPPRDAVLVAMPLAPVGQIGQKANRTAPVDTMSDDSDNSTIIALTRRSSSKDAHLGRRIDNATLQTTFEENRDDKFELAAIGDDEFDYKIGEYRQSVQGVQMAVLFVTALLQVAFNIHDSVPFQSPGELGIQSWITWSNPDGGSEVKPGLGWPQFSKVLVTSYHTMSRLDKFAGCSWGIFRKGTFEPLLVGKFL